MYFQIDGKKGLCGILQNIHIYFSSRFKSTNLINLVRKKSINPEWKRKQDKEERQQSFFGGRKTEQVN